LVRLLGATCPATVTLVTGTLRNFRVFSMSMALEALVLSRDPDVLKTIGRALDDANIAAQVCSTADDALHTLNTHKYDTFVVDCDDVPGAPDVLQQLRKGKSNRSCIAFALVNGRTSVRQAFELGANFALDKPVSMERVVRSVKAAQGLIMRERRRYHRHLVTATGTIVVDGITELPVGVLTISEGGVSIECARQLDRGGAARLKIVLPGSKKPLDLKGEIMWTDTEGRAGIRFQVLPLETKKELETWLEQRALVVDKGAIFINATGRRAMEG
jgi:ActR/RegA family two-component response regulator